MESGQQEDSKTSREENDESENVEDDEGTGRSYECMFCKRGFNTAQALGGHMNIHRKDRAKIRQPTVPSVSRRAEEEYGSTGFFPAVSSYQPHYSAPPVAQRSHHMYLPGSTSSPRYPPAYQREEQTQKRQPLGMIDNDWRTSLSLQIGPSQNEDTEEEHTRDDKEDELDLELRLGHDP